MHDDLADLERVLRDHAAEIPHLQGVPPTMLRRARRRMARNALVSVVAAGLVVVGVSAGVAGLRATHGEAPGRSPDPVPSTSSCAAGDLLATAALDGAAGSVVGSIDLTNVGERTCTLEGRPTVSVSDSTGVELSVLVDDVAPMWQSDGASRPDGWPVVRLRPETAAAIRVGWTNPCPQLVNPARWSVELPSGGEALEVSGADAIWPPSCLGPDQPSTLEVGPFEPSTDG